MLFTRSLDYLFGPSLSEAIRDNNIPENKETEEKASAVADEWNRSFKESYPCLASCFSPLQWRLAYWTSHCLIQKREIIDNELQTLFNKSTQTITSQFENVGTSRTILQPGNLSFRNKDFLIQKQNQKPHRLKSPNFEEISNALNDLTPIDLAVLLKLSTQISDVIEPVFTRVLENHFSQPSLKKIKGRKIEILHSGAALITLFSTAYSSKHPYFDRIVSRVELAFDRVSGMHTLNHQIVLKKDNVIVASKRSERPTVSRHLIDEIFSSNTDYSSFLERTKEELKEAKARPLKLHYGEVKDLKKKMKNPENQRIYIEKSHSDPHISRLLARIGDPQQKKSLALIYGRMLTLKEHYAAKGYHVFLHAQSHYRMILTYFMDHLYRKLHPNQDLSHHKPFRMTTMFSEKEQEELHALIEKREFGTPEGQNDKSKRTWLLSADAYHGNDAKDESAFYFMEQGSDMDKGDWRKSFDATMKSICDSVGIQDQLFERTKVYFDKLLDQMPEQVDCHNLYLICIPKKDSDKYYRSHALGEPCDCHGEDHSETIETLQTVKTVEEVEQLKCKETKIVPTVRLHTPKLTPDCPIHLLTSPSIVMVQALKTSVKNLVEAIFGDIDFKNSLEKRS